MAAVVATAVAAVAAGFWTFRDDAGGGARGADRAVGPRAERAVGPRGTERADALVEVRQLLEDAERAGRAPEGHPGFCDIEFEALEPSCLVAKWQWSMTHAGVEQRCALYRVLDGRPVPSAVGEYNSGADYSFCTEESYMP